MEEFIVAQYLPLCMIYTRFTFTEMCISYLSSREENVMAFWGSNMYLDEGTERVHRARILRSSAFAGGRSRTVQGQASPAKVGTAVSTAVA